jgi:hypothetical protein
MIEELDQIVLAEDLPELGLLQGDLGTVVLVHRGGEGFTVEFMTLEGQTIDVVTLRASQVRPIGGADVPRVRTRSAVPAAGD